MDKLKVGIIGAGQIATKSHLPKYADMQDEVEIVAIADVREEVAKERAEQFGIPNVYTDFRKLLERDDLDSVDVCLHNNLHMPVTIEALKAGKHVYCEKPIAGSYADGKKMLEAAKETGKKLYIQLAMIFKPETRAAKRMIDAGELGKIYHSRTYHLRRRGRPYVDGYGTAQFVQKEHASGGALIDIGIYNISQMLYLMGNPQAELVSGITYQEVDMDEERRASGGYNVEEFGGALVRFPGGVTMDIMVTWAAHIDQFATSIVLGSNGGIKLSDPPVYYNYKNGLCLDAEMGTGFMVRQEKLLDAALARSWETPQHHWVAALKGRVELIPAAEIALNTMRISEGIYLSSKLGREVTLAEIEEASESTAMKV